MRLDNRNEAELRKIDIKVGVNKWAEGSCEFHLGDTIVYITASVEERVPFFLKGSGSGWVTAEYCMVPRATENRVQREARTGRVSGRTYEIQRLIGRSLRAGVHLKSLGERTIHVDCEVIQADGGTRTASISGGFVAMYEAIKRLKPRGITPATVVRSFISAVSIGMFKRKPLLDLNYYEDSRADVDMNVVMDDRGDIIEIQGTAEHASFSRKHLLKMLDLAEAGTAEVIKLQKQALKLIK